MTKTFDKQICAETNCDNPKEWDLKEFHKSVNVKDWREQVKATLCISCVENFESNLSNTTKIGNGEYGQSLHYTSLKIQTEKYLKINGFI